jgi:glucosamine-6-phosphate deaminase
VWLAGETGKSILKLDDIDYREHRLTPLLARHGSSGAINGLVFNALSAKVRGRSKLPTGKRVIVFSPHPDDDVISAGGTLRKLHQNGNHVVVAYQTSGNIAVFDHELRRYLDFVCRASQDFGIATDRLPRFVAEVDAFLKARKPGEVDSGEVLLLKRRIREVEARSGLETLGIGADSSRFLNLPFYQTGQVRKDPIGDKDVAIIQELLTAERPDLLLVAAISPIRTARTACATRPWRARSSATTGGRPRCGSTAAPGRSGRSPRRTSSCRCPRKS